MIRAKQIEKFTEAVVGYLIDDNAININKIKDITATPTEINHLVGLTESIVTSLSKKLNTSSLQRDGYVVWTDDDVIASAKAIMTKITSELQPIKDSIVGGLVFKGNWSTAPTTGIKTGYQYKYDSGFPPTPEGLEVGDVLTAIVDNADKSNRDHWIVTQTNIFGAVTSPVDLESERVVVGISGQAVQVSYLTAPLVKINRGVMEEATAADLPQHNHTASDITGFPIYKSNITPAGALNGTNKVFTLPDNTEATSVCLYINGIMQEQGATKDYTVGGTGNKTITLTATTYTPVADDSVLVSYKVV